MKRETRILFLSLLLLATCLGASPPTRAQPVADRVADRFAYSTDPAAVIVEFRERFSTLADPDPGPHLRVFGDGRVEIHYPHYMNRAGDWRVQLTRAELRDLLRKLVDHGVAEFDTDRTRGRMRARREEDRARGTLFAAFDASTTELELSLEQYQPADAGEAEIRGLRRSIRWKGLRADTRHFRGIPELAGLAAAQSELRALMERPDRVRMQSPVP